MAWLIIISRVLRYPCLRLSYVVFVDLHLLKQSHFVLQIHRTYTSVLRNDTQPKRKTTIAEYCFFAKILPLKLVVYKYCNYANTGSLCLHLTTYIFGITYVSTLFCAIWSLMGEKFMIIKKFIFYINCSLSIDWRVRKYSNTG